MQKKLIALAVAAAVAAPMAASAAPTIYGKLHFSADYANSDGSGDDDDPVTGVSRASRLGFKGSEALGGSLKAIWQVEFQLNSSALSSGTSDVKLRNTFAGLSGNWGTVLLGRHDTPYKIATGKLDPNSDRISDYNNIMGTTSGSGTIFDERAPQTIAYITPNFNGFHAAAAYIEHKFNEKTTTYQNLNLGSDNCGSGSGTLCGDDENRAFSLMGMWESGNWFVSGAYEYHEGAVFQAPGTGQDYVTGDDDIQAYKLGVGWKPGNWRLSLVGEVIDDKLNDSPNKRNAGYGSVGYKFGKNVVTGSVGYADKSDANCDLAGDYVFVGGTSCDDKAANYSLALDHNFSKRTTVYAAYSYMDNDDDARFSLNAGQQIGDGYGPQSPGDSPWAVSLGIIHKF